MARFMVTSLLVAVTLAAAVEARDVVTIGASRSMPPISRKLLGFGHDHPVQITGDDVQRTCDQVKFKTMCRSLTRLPGVTTPEALLQAAVRVGITKARQAKRRVDAYAATYHGGNPLASMLGTCSTAYGSVADSLEETQHLLEAGHPTGYDLNMKLSSVTTSALDCNNAFEERPEIPVPFPGTLKNVYRVADNVLNIAYVVKHV